MAIAELLTLIVVIGIIWFIFLLVKKAAMLVINSVIGFFALFAVQAFVLSGLEINFWSVIIVAIGGIIGLIAVICLHLFGIAF